LQPSNLGRFFTDPLHYLKKYFHVFIWTAYALSSQLINQTLLKRLSAEGWPESPCEQNNKPENAKKEAGLKE
jgi:hypothetical protein